MVEEAVLERLPPEIAKNLVYFTIAVVLNMYVDDGTKLSILI